MKRHNLRCVLAVSGITLLASLPAKGQYPTIPEEVSRASQAAKAAADKRSDEAFAQAMPTIKEWEARGKPYIPWASHPFDLPQARIPAFPGAQGGGIYSFGGRGGKVFVISNLNDSGPGSFREACEAGGPRIVVFNVAGIIQLKDRIRIRAPYITINGATAPGDGVCIAGNTVELESHDIVIRHMRFRRGATDVGDRNDSIGGNPVGNVMIDHVSASWGLDENMSMYRHMYELKDGSEDLKNPFVAGKYRQMHSPRDPNVELKLPTVNITIQNSIFSEGLNTFNHAFGSTIGGRNSTFHHNLWACNTGRNPSVGMDGDFGFVNNVIFNWRHRTIDGGDYLSCYNIINNYFKPGPATPKTDPIAWRILKPEQRRGRDVPKDYGQAFVSGNIVEGNDKVTADNWDGGVQIELAPSDPRNEKELLAGIRVERPFSMAPIAATSAKQAYEDVLVNAGATLPRRDAVDVRVVEMVRSGQPTAIANSSIREDLRVAGAPANTIDKIVELIPLGIITHPSQVGGYPQYSGEPRTDSDNDGMPDEWETRHGLNPNDPSDSSGDLNNDGYTNIEDFINGLDPKATYNWMDLRNHALPTGAQHSASTQ